jgi:hypothetical protein
MVGMEEDRISAAEENGDDYDNEDEDEGEDSFSSSYDSEDDSSFDSAIDAEAQRLMDALQGGGGGGGGGGGPNNSTIIEAPAKTPEETWAEFVKGLESSTVASVKVTDTLVAWVVETSNEEERMALAEGLCTDLIRAVETSQMIIIHIILGRVFLSILSAAQQEQLYRAILTKHASTITYWKLGSDDSTDTCGIPTTALLRSMSSTEIVSEGWSNLTELEIRGMEVTTVAEVEMMIQFIHRAPIIRQFNLLGMVMSDTLVATEGLFDRLFATVETLSGFDELQLCRTVDVVDNNGAKKKAKTTPTNTMNNSTASPPPLISPSAMEHLLSVKPKWWRMALDGMALDDRHLQIIGSALKESKDCKMNDLLSIQDNPKVTPKGLHALYTVCVNKQRMGLVLSDDPSWVATFDLVRPLNNLHRRLEYIKEDGSGGYVSRDRWIEWLAVVGNLPWIEEARKVNYLWFALLEQPELLNNAASPLVAS